MTRRPVGRPVKEWEEGLPTLKVAVPGSYAVKWRPAYLSDGFLVLRKRTPQVRGAASRGLLPAQNGVHSYVAREPRREDATSLRAFLRSLLGATCLASPSLPAEPGLAQPLESVTPRLARRLAVLGSKTNGSDGAK